MDAAQRQAVAERTLDSMLTTLDNEETYVAANGPKASYTLPTGESLSWPDWKEAYQRMIKAQLELIQTLGGPFGIRSRART